MYNPFLAALARKRTGGQNAGAEAGVVAAVCRPDTGITGQERQLARVIDALGSVQRDRAMVVVAGPTASGKSALALDLARRFGGCVINADSMQVYRELRVVTARPTVEEEQSVPHSLYGVLGGDEVCSAARWADMAAQEIVRCREQGMLPVVTGGTGLYLRALVHGLSPIPDVPWDVRVQARALMDDIGNVAFHALLTERDPVTAARLSVGDTQRQIRALEVLEATGRSITAWQKEPPVPVVDADVLTIILDPARPWLYQRCDLRFVQMLEQGARDEVQALDAMGLPADALVLKALGVPELRALLHGVMSEAEAIDAAQQATRNFAKRQVTWFRHQLPATLRLSGEDPRQWCEQATGLLAGL